MLESREHLKVDSLVFLFLSVRQVRCRVFFGFDCVCEKKLSHFFLRIKNIILNAILQGQEDRLYWFISAWDFGEALPLSLSLRTHFYKKKMPT